MSGNGGIHTKWEETKIKWGGDGMEDQKCSVMGIHYNKI